MADALKEQTDVEINVEILGVNYTLDNPQANHLMTFQRTLPWLQDTTEVNVQTNWEAKYRDVIVVGPDGEKVFVFNLSTNNLADGSHYATLKTALESAGAIQDADNDGLDDRWEASQPEGLALDATDEVVARYALGTTDTRIISTLSGSGQLILEATRRLGNWGRLRYIPEISTDLVNWESGEAQIVELDERGNDYNGTGMGLARYQILELVTNRPMVAARLRAVIDPE